MGGYRLGIDLGTTFSTAAVLRADQSRPEMAVIDGDPSVPSVMFLAPDGTELVGAVAAARAWDHPARTAREFKRRFGDPVGIIVGGTSYTAQRLTARLLARMVADVAAVEGGPPDAVTLTHPANWGPYKRELFEQVPGLARLADADIAYLTEPEAAAAAYAAVQPLAVGATVAVYDLGGGTFDAAVLARTDDGFEILGSPQGIEQLGGVDLDDVVVAHVQQVLGERFAGLDNADPDVQDGFAHLRVDCRRAKELLSEDTATTIRVNLPALLERVRLTRTEFEDLIRPTLAATVDSLDAAIESAGVGPEDLTAILLVGGSSRIPLVADLLSRRFGRPIAVDAHPKYAIATGAALHDPTAVPSAGPSPAAGAGPVGTATAASVTVDPANPDAAVPGAGPGAPASPAREEATSTPGQMDEDTSRPDGVVEQTSAPVGPQSVEQPPPLVETVAAAGPTEQSPMPAPAVRDDPTIAAAGESPPDQADRRRPGRRGMVIGGAVLAGLVAILAVGAAALGGGDDADRGAPLTSAPGEISPCRDIGTSSCITGVAVDGDDFIVWFDSDVEVAEDGLLAGGAQQFFLAPPSKPLAELDPLAETTGWSGFAWPQASPARIAWFPDYGRNGVTMAREFAATELCLAFGADASGPPSPGTGNCANITGLLDGSQALVGEMGRSGTVETGLDFARAALGDTGIWVMEPGGPVVRVLADQVGVGAAAAGSAEEAQEAEDVADGTEPSAQSTVGDAGDLESVVETTVFAPVDDRTLVLARFREKDGPPGVVRYTPGEDARGDEVALSPFPDFEAGEAFDPSAIVIGEQATWVGGDEGRILRHPLPESADFAEGPVEVIEVAHPADNQSSRNGTDVTALASGGGSLWASLDCDPFDISACADDDPTVLVRLDETSGEVVGTVELPFAAEASVLVFAHDSLWVGSTADDDDAEGNRLLRVSSDLAEVQEVGAFRGVAVGPSGIFTVDAASDELIELSTTGDIVGTVTTLDPNDARNGPLFADGAVWVLGTGGRLDRYDVG